MAALTDLSDIINRVTGGGSPSGSPETIFFYKDARVGGAAAAAAIVGQITSLWQYNGQPSDGPVPTSNAGGENPTNTSTGSMRQTNPTGSAQKWLLGINSGCVGAGTLFLHDRLWQQSGFSGTVTGNQTITSSLSRYTSGSGNQIWIEIYTQIGVTGTVISASYTNQDGTAGKITPAKVIGATNNREAQRLIQLPLASGDTGVRSVDVINMAVSTGTAGGYSLLIIHPITTVPIGLAGVGSVRDLISGLPGVMEILPNACLMLSWYANTVAVPQVFGSLHMIEK